MKGYLPKRIHSITCTIIFLLYYGNVLSQNRSFQQTKSVTYKVSGVVFKAKNRKPIKDAKISTFKIIKETNTGQTLFLSNFSSTPTYYTSSDGVFLFELNANQEYLLEITAEGYKSRQYTMQKQEVSDGQKIAIEIPLIAGVDQKIEGVVFDINSKQPAGNTIVELLEPSTKTVKSIVTGKDGRFSFPMNTPSVFELFIQKNQYFEQRISIDLSNSTERFREFFIKKVKTGEQIQLDTFLFNVNSDEILEENLEALAKVEDILNDNPTLLIEIGCHSDSRGDDIYNLELSQRRANTIANYLIERGVAANRLVPKGYGETQLLNECVNGIKCSSEKHLINRRIIITIIGEIE